MRYRGVYVQKATRRIEKSVNTHNRLRYFLTNKIFLLQVMYRYVRTYDFHCKMCNNNMFFHCLCIALMEKHDLYSVILETVHDTVQYRYCILSLLSSLED